MANLQSSEGPSASDVSDQSSESTLQLNIKTLDSRICSFYVDKNIVISAFKEKIAGEIGVPVGQQRLIFRGKVLNDDHLLSEYIERNHSPGSNSGEATSSDGNRGQDSTAGGPRNRIGQIPQGVALGTLHVGDAGETGIPDLTRVIGAVLNSIGIANMPGGLHPRLLEFMEMLHHDISQRLHDEMGS
ncbi:UNVERIFIED_CONTAM: Large proline-rich protein BAG6 [Sesamum angustifolium]|uniref:Large proline-rich protein BAG6 n=1 Tax=Sesamum angustifolium TaxID=2727405 RepID=A0AAW2LVQ9_9LAMI